MKNLFLRSLSAVALAGVFALSANAETVPDEFTVDFADYEIGTMLNTFWGNPNPNIAVVPNPAGAEGGNLLYVSGFDKNEDDTPQLNDGGGKVWNTLARIPNLTLPKGYNVSHMTMIVVNYMPTQADAMPFGIQLRNPDTDYLTFGEEPVANEWNTAVFDPSEFVDGDGNKISSKASSFDFCFGIKGSTEYYVRDITIYVEKEMTQREIDEEALDKTKAACLSFDFNDQPEGPSNYLGSNGHSINRADMIFDKDPVDANNICAHIIYGGYTNIFLWDMITAPEGYTFDDLRLVEYDIYETDIPGVDCTNDSEWKGKNGAPQLKVKKAPWDLDSETGSCGNSPLENVNEWTHVQFLPSQITWATRNMNKPVLDENGDAQVDSVGNVILESVACPPDEVRDEFGKLTTFNISLGFFPCLNQCYVDNVELWFQKSATTAIEDVKVVAEPKETVVYNLMGMPVMRTADKGAIRNLPAGIYIVNGKKYLVK